MISTYHTQISRRHSESHGGVYMLNYGKDLKSISQNLIDNRLDLYILILRQKLGDAIRDRDVGRRWSVGQAVTLLIYPIRVNVEWNTVKGRVDKWLVKKIGFYLDKGGQIDRLDSFNLDLVVGVCPWFMRSRKLVSIH